MNTPASNIQPEVQNIEPFKVQSDLSKRVFENMSSLKKEKPSDAMNIEVPKTFSGLNAQIMDKVEEKSSTLMTKVDK